MKKCHFRGENDEIKRLFEGTWFFGPGTPIFGIFCPGGCAHRVHEFKREILNANRSHGQPLFEESESPRESGGRLFLETGPPFSRGGFPSGADFTRARSPGPGRGLPDHFHRHFPRKIEPKTRVFPLVHKRGFLLGFCVGDPRTLRGAPS